MSDVIITLGRGIYHDGTLPPDPRARVQKAVELYKQGQAPIIVMSGSWSFHLETQPQRTEAAAMKRYAIELGVPDEAVIEETLSKDTLSNAYFTKVALCQPRNWRDINVIASDEHMLRVKYLFGKVYGPDYRMTFITSERVLSDRAYQRELAHEQQSLQVAKQALASFTDGDDKAIGQALRQHHPAYRED